MVNVILQRRRAADLMLEAIEKATQLPVEVHTTEFASRTTARGRNHDRWRVLVAAAHTTGVVVDVTVVNVAVLGVRQLVVERLYCQRTCVCLRILQMFGGLQMDFGMGVIGQSRFHNGSHVDGELGSCSTGCRAWNRVMCNTVAQVGVSGRHGRVSVRRRIGRGVEGAVEKHFVCPFI